MRLRDKLRVLLDSYGLAAALDIPWLDGSWSDLWPLIRRLSEIKQRDPGFLDAAQQLRDRALDEIEHMATTATREIQR
jgi:hypothetical protein